EASDAGLSGSYRAVLAYSGGDWSTRFTSGARWVRPDGVAIAENTVAFLNGSKLPLAAINLTARGAGSSGASHPAWVGSIQYNCDDWTNPNAPIGSVYGDSNMSNRRWGPGSG